MIKRTPYQLALLLCVSLLTSCGPSKSSGNTANAKRYPLTGRVVSIDKPGKSVSIDGDAIPGFMDAMTMPYTIKDPSVLDKLNAGDQIKADIVVSGDESWLENVTVTGHSSPPAPKPTAALHIPASGEPVPDFTLINQSGKSISLHQYRGKALLITFIYTRCPFPDYCPRVSGEFAEINRKLQSDPTLDHKTHLLSISFDPEHDTPKALRDYGFSCAGSKQPALFNHWEFAVAPATQLPAIANFFALTYAHDGAAITHSLSTAVIAPDGRIFKWYSGNDWQPGDLIKDATIALHSAT